MLKMKKIISVVLMCAMVFSLVQITALGVYTEPTTAEKQFNEDFEDYQILNLKDEYDAAYYAGTSVYKNVIDVATPSDKEFYTTYADKYPNGTASVYEGNLADAGMSVPDPSGVQIAGGTKNIGQDDGWYGYYKGVEGNYNIYNRRLSVMSRNGADEINQTQYASLNPKTNSSTIGKSELNRNNVALDGYSYISSRVNLSKTDANKMFGKSGIAITQNPNKEYAAQTYDAVYFTDSEESGKLDVYFNGTKVGTVTLSNFSYTSTAVTSSGEWYTIQYRIYNGENAKKHKLTIIDDVNKKIAIETDWTDIDLTETEFNFDDSNTYGIRFYVHASTVNDTARMRLDDISFHNGEYVEDFDNYNIKIKQNGTDTRIGNGFKGNRNTTAYEHGVYEGNMARNVFVHRVLKEGTANYDDIIVGNITQWQGYVKNVSGINEVRYLNAISTWQYPCTVLSPSARGQGSNGFDTQALVLRANAIKAAKSQSVYAGMDKADFSDKTTVSAVIKIQQAQVGDSVALQLTKGRDTAPAKNADYSGASHTAYYDVFKMKDNKFYVGNSEIGSYETTGAYRFEYTVDATDKANPTHELKIFNNVTNALVAHEKESAMNLTTGAPNFNFENDVTGFRFVADAPTASTGDIIAYFDDVKVKKTLPASLTGVNSINDAIYSAEDNKVTLTADMAEAINEASVFIFAVYDSNDVLQKVYKADYSALNVYENAIEITVEDDYASPNYYGRVFFWNSLSDLTPRTDAANVILK